MLRSSIRSGDCQRSAFAECLAGVLVLALLCTPVFAEDTPAAVAQGAESDSASESAPVVLNGRELFSVKGSTLIPARKRAAAISSRLLALAANPTIDPESLSLLVEGDITRIAAGDTTLLSLSDHDVIRGQRERVAELVLQEIKREIQIYREERSPRVLLLSATRALVASLVAAGLFYLMFRARRWIFDWLLKRYSASAREVKIQSLRLFDASHVWAAVRNLANLLCTVLAVVLLYLYLTRVLSLFPWTRPLSADLFRLFLEPLQVMGQSVLESIPNLVFLLMLVLVTRYVLRILHMVAQGIEQQTIRFEDFDAEWAIPTYKIVRTLVIAFAVVVAYPYVPGSGSQAFKGMSLFLGVIFSLGSSSVIANVIAGYTMTYRRAFRVGDRIRVGEITGFVTDARLLVTRLRTVKNEEVVLPNSEILSNAVVNYSTLARQHGLILHTTVGIGYETPWRQVEAMLLQAADRTPGIDKSPAPFVLQKALADFAITYEINGYTRDAVRIGRTYSALYQNILDVFNEHGVQIMTPAYEGDPEIPKVVPPGQWYPQPATAPATEGQGPNPR